MKFNFLKNFGKLSFGRFIDQDVARSNIGVDKRKRKVLS